MHYTAKDTLTYFAQRVIKSNIFSAAVVKKGLNTPPFLTIYRKSSL